MAQTGRCDWHSTLAATVKVGLRHHGDSGGTPPPHLTFRHTGPVTQVITRDSNEIEEVDDTDGSMWSATAL
jgi:hypothetical protein